MRAGPRGNQSGRLVLLVLCAALFAFLVRGVLGIPETEAGLAPVVQARLAESGVSNPVTAVLLNFRGYDTLLEIAVLMLATIGVLSLRTETSGIWAPLAPVADPVLSSMTRFLVPLMILVAGYLLWAGEHAPGGAFQAGAVLGAAGVLLALSGYTRPGWVTRVALRFAIAVGFLVFLVVALAPLLSGDAMLRYPPAWAKVLMLVVEGWLTASIGVILISLFIASATPSRHEREL